MVALSVKVKFRLQSKMTEKNKRKACLVGVKLALFFFAKNIALTILVSVLSERITGLI